MGRASQEKMTGKSYEYRREHPKHDKTSTWANKDFSPVSALRMMALKVQHSVPSLFTRSKYKRWMTERNALE